MKKPRLCDYNVKALIALGNQAYDDITRDEIRKILIDKFMSVNYSILFLLNKFSASDGIMKEVYAEIIMKVISERELCLSSSIVDEVVSLVSMDTLTVQMMQSNSLEIKDKCRNEFWKRALEKENDTNLVKKKYK